MFSNSMRNVVVLFRNSGECWMCPLCRRNEIAYSKPKTCTGNPKTVMNITEWHLKHAF
jgi:hypothetical protein